MWGQIAQAIAQVFDSLAGMSISDDETHRLWSENGKERANERTTSLTLTSNFVILGLIALVVIIIFKE